jgi:integrase/recombinase XerD
MRRRRVSIPPEGWSPQDQTALRLALTPGSRRQRTGRGSHWRAASAQTLCESTSYFAGFIAAAGVDVGNSTLSEFCTMERVWSWIDDMRGRSLAPATIKMRAVGLQQIMRVMYPFTSWGWLYDIVNELSDGLLESRRRKMPKIKHSRELLRLGVRLIMEAETRAFIRPHLHHVHARDGVIVVFLALRPLRLKNLTGLRLGVHLRRQESGAWRIQVSASETKNWETIDWVIPEDLALFLERYLAVNRPALLARRNGADAETDGLPLSYENLSRRVQESTKRAFGVSISPHRFRDAAATTATIEFPTNLRTALALLGDRDPHTIQHHYDQANSLVASQKLILSIDATKAELRAKGLIP